jgi:small subunit ribosomal protein S8e
MSISRNSRHKRRATGGRMPIHKKKRKFEMGRVPTMTKLGAKKVINVRGRGGNIKRRALRND